MTKTQKQRLAVAKDVIAQLKLQKFTAKEGVYVDHAAISPANYGAELQTVLRKELTAQKPCEVCAMGACFISSVRLYDEFKLTGKTMEWGNLDQVAIKSKVAKLFTRREMRVIESSFENEGAFIKLYGERDEWDNNSGGYQEFLSNLEPTERLIFLMEVVLANPRQQVTLRVAKDTLLSFFLQGRYKAERQKIGL